MRDRSISVRCVMRWCTVVVGVSIVQILALGYDGEAGIVGELVCIAVALQTRYHTHAIHDREAATKCIY